MNEPGTRPERQTLQQLEVVGTLQPQEFEELARKTVVEELHPDRRLFVRGHRDQWTYYLLQGRVQLEWFDGHSDIVSGGSREARAPLANQQPRQATATSLERIRFIRIDNNLLEVLSQKVGADSYQLEELQPDDEQAHNRLFYAIYHDYLADTLTLPHLPDVALKVREAVQDPECDSHHVAQIIQADPVLAARLIHAANSPLYGVQTPIYSCKGAVTFLGLNTTRDLVLTYTLRDLFNTSSALLRARMTELWRHSALVGAVSYVLAAMTPGLDKDRALLAGLLHDIGALPVIHYAGQMPEVAAQLAQDNSQLEVCIHALRGQVGAMVLRQWQFTGEMVNIALEAENWQRDPDAHPDYADVVLIAQQLLAHGTDVEQLATLQELPAWRKVARGRLDAELVADVLREAEQDVADVLHLLS